MGRKVKQMDQEKKKKGFPIMQVIPIVGILISVVFIYLGFAKYGFWDTFKGPRPGFFPIIISCLMLVASLVALATSYKEENIEWPKENWILPLSVLGIFVATFVIGLLPSIAIFVLLWLKKFEKCTWKTTLTVFVIIMAVVVGVFVLWLGIPFPKGMILDAINN